MTPVTELPTTLQGFYDNAWSWFVIDGHERCVATGGSCQYRDAAGNRCAIGASIPDGQYQYEMEGENVDVLLTQFFAYPAFGVNVVRALQCLQRIHDYFDESQEERWPVYVRSELTKFAYDYGLQVPA